MNGRGEDAPRKGPLQLLFVCVGNSCRSQMAEGFARAMGGDQVKVTSAGVVPADKLAPRAVHVMSELTIDISSQAPSLLTKELIDSADRVFTMGCDARSLCPANWLEGVIEWELEDPMGKGVEKYREVRDLILEQVQRLLEAEGIERVPMG